MPTNETRPWVLLNGPLRIRRDDRGDGRYGAPRDGRPHRGIDLLAQPGEPVYMPADGRILRRARPYDDDDRLDGLLLQLHGAPYRMKIFYIEPLRTSGPIQTGEVMGRVQSLEHRYPGIQPHIHVEVFDGNERINPEDVLDIASGS